MQGVGRHGESAHTVMCLQPDELAHRDGVPTSDADRFQFGKGTANQVADVGTNALSARNSKHGGGNRRQSGMTLRSKKLTPAVDPVGQPSTTKKGKRLHADTSMPFLNPFEALRNVDTDGMHVAH